MKNAQSLVVILGLLVLGAIGYYFYISYSSIEDPFPYEDSFSAGEYMMLDQEIQETEYEILELEYEFSELEFLDFEDGNNETQLEGELYASEQTEMTIDQELSELESLDF